MAGLLGLSLAEIKLLIESENLIVQGGLDLLDANDNFLADLTVRMDDTRSEVVFEHSSKIRTRAKIVVVDELDWGRQRLRPWIELSNGWDDRLPDPVTWEGEPVFDSSGSAITYGTTDRPGSLRERWNLGVFLMETPRRVLGETPVTYEVDCYDKTVLLETPVGRTVHLAAGDLLLDIAAELIRKDLLTSIGRFGVDADLDGVADGWDIVSIGSVSSTSQSMTGDTERVFQRVIATPDSTDIRRLTPEVPSLAIAAGHTYVLRFTTKGERSPSTFVQGRLTWLEEDGATAVSSSTMPLATEAQWQTTVIEMTAPVGASKVKLSIDIGSIDGDPSPTTLDVYKVSMVDKIEDARVLIDTVAAQKIATKEATWPVGDADTALSIINELLDLAGCSPLWADREGTYRMTLLPSLTTDPPVWNLDQDSLTSMVADERTETNDFWDVPNTWIFRRSVDPATEDAPVTGEGLTNIINQSLGPASIDARGGRVVRAVHTVDASDQTSFEAQVRTIVGDEQGLEQTFEISTSPLPELWDRQVLTYSDSAVSGNVATTDAIRATTDKWTLPLGGDDMKLTLTGIPANEFPAFIVGMFHGGDEEFEFNGFRYHHFTIPGSHTLTRVKAGQLSICGVAGSGPGGNGDSADPGKLGGGGSGGEAGLILSTVVIDEDLTVVVGAAGVVNNANNGIGTAGGDSSIIGGIIGTLLHLTGGRPGGSSDAGTIDGVPGVLGSGGGKDSGSGAGTGGDGSLFDGGGASSTDNAAGGGAGSAGPGGPGMTADEVEAAGGIGDGHGGDGGPGMYTTIPPDPMWLGSGGGGAASNIGGAGPVDSPGNGGLGGGGIGAFPGNPGGSGLPGTGAGGGGGRGANVGDRPGVATTGSWWIRYPVS